MQPLKKKNTQTKILSIMNKYTSSLLIFVIFISSSFVVSAQSSSVPEVKNICINALENNNIEQFVNTFSDPVEITLPDVENSYSKVQAIIVMRKFLQANSTKSFSVKQSGKSTGGAEFIIGELETTKGIKYQVYLLITITDNKAFLHLVEFEVI